MESYIKKIELNDEQIISLPLFMKHIFYNDMVPIQYENRLMKFQNKFYISRYRAFSPARIICKVINPLVNNKNS